MSMLTGLKMSSLSYFTDHNIMQRGTHEIQFWRAWNAKMIYTDG